jgi:hypothetical protein
MYCQIKSSGIYLLQHIAYLLLSLVNLTSTQVEALFGEMEYIELRLKALGVVASEKIDNT